MPTNGAIGRPDLRHDGCIAYNHEHVFEATGSLLTDHAGPPGQTRTRHTADLVQAACLIVERDGLAGLTLRPLAEALGVSVSVLTNRHGSRSGVLAAICAAARTRDAILLDEWHGTLAQAGTPTPAIAAELSEAFLDDLCTRGRPLSFLFLELMHASGGDDALRAALQPWADARRALWDRLPAHALPAALRDWWYGYMIAEVAYGLALNTLPAYRILRRLCLRRVFAGGAAAAPEPEDMRLFAPVAAHLQAGAAERIAVHRTDDAVAAGIARACGIRLAAHGVSALTHRAIAQDVGIPHTTLSYRFPTQHDLVLAGLEHIVAHVLAAVEADTLADTERLRTQDDGRRLDLARASLAVAAAAARMPALVPHAARMRSRRGSNLARVFRKYLPGAAGIDTLCVQVVSLGLTGLANAEPPGEAADRAVAAAFAASARWLGRAD